MATRPIEYRGALQLVPVSNAPSASSGALTSATTFMGFCFIAVTSEPLVSVCVYMTKVGTPTDIRASLYTDVNGLPNTAGAVANTEVSLSITATGYYTFTFNTAYTGVTAGGRYWVVFKNYTGTPSANYPSINYQSAGMLPVVGDYTTHTGWGNGKASTTTGDTGWGSYSGNVSACLLTFQSGLRMGTTVRNLFISITTSNTQYGLRFRSPELVMRMDSLVTCIYKVAAPTSALTAKVYVNGVLVTTSSPVPAASISTVNCWLSFNFPTVVIPPFSTVIVAVCVGTVDGTNFYRMTGVTADTNNMDIFPYGTIAVTSTDGVAWTDCSSTFIPSILIGLESGNMLKLPPLNRRQYNTLR